MKVLVCGGPTDWVKGAFQSKLALAGLEMQAHWPMRKRPPAEVPKGVDLVLILQDFIGHSLRKSIIGRVPKDVPYIELPMRKWSTSMRLLKTKGYVQESEPLKSEEKEIVAKQKKVASTQKPKRAVKKSAEIVEITKFSLEDAIDIEFGSTLLARPEDIDKAVKSVSLYYEGTIPEAAIRRDIYSVWANKAFSHRTKKVAEYDDAVSGWILRYATQYKEDFGEYPSYRTINSASSPIFGRKVNHERITKVSRGAADWFAAIKTKTAATSKKRTVPEASLLNAEKAIIKMNNADEQTAESGPAEVTLSDFITGSRRAAKPEPKKKPSIIITADEDTLKDIHWMLLKSGLTGDYKVELTD